MSRHGGRGTKRSWNWSLLTIKPSRFECAYHVARCAVRASSFHLILLYLSPKVSSLLFLSIAVRSPTISERDSCFFTLRDRIDKMAHHTYTHGNVPSDKCRTLVVLKCCVTFRAMRRRTRRPLALGRWTRFTVRTRFNHSFNRLNIESLTRSQFPVYTIYAQKICLSGAGQLCAGRSWAYESVPAFQMSAYVKDRRRTATKRACMELCLNEREFQCRWGSLT